MKNKKQFKRDEKQNSNKLHLDQYYTSDELAQYCIDKTYSVIGEWNISEVIEPSAGNGAFSLKITDCLAYDIEPKHPSIKKQDFLSLELDYMKGRLVIGNPPYGSRLNLAKAFCNKSFDVAEYVSFILPISQLNNDQSIYRYDLIHSEDLCVQKYSERDVHCCLNIYRKPKSGKDNKRKSYKNSEIIEIIEIREVIVNNNPRRNRELGDFDYDFAICAWGASVGIPCSDGEFAKTFFVKINDVENKEYYKNLILKTDWKKLYPMTATPNLLQWQVYKWVEENQIES